MLTSSLSRAPETEVTWKITRTGSIIVATSIMRWLSMGVCYPFSCFCSTVDPTCLAWTVSHLEVMYLVDDELPSTFDGAHCRCLANILMWLKQNDVHLPKKGFMKTFSIV